MDAGGGVCVNGRFTGKTTLFFIGGRRMERSAEVNLINTG